ncbi:helix-turn-helix domain-containing protein [Thiocapsa roseopersicina]|nr:helix-turn-helix domain-containing protein [Thiocapsa roseopersicina]
MRRWQWAIWSHEGPARVAQRAVAQVLFDYLVTSPDGRVFPSIETIAEKTALTEKTVGGHLDALVAAGWIARRLRERGGQGWRRYEYTLHFPKHIDPSTDDFLKRAERKRLDAIDEHRITEEWPPRDDAEAERRAAKGDYLGEEYLIDNFDTDRFPALDVRVFYRLADIRKSVATITKTWLNTNAGQLAQYKPGEQAILVEWIESNEKSSLPSHQACRAILKQRRAAA